MTRTEAAQRNGALSHGPVTAEGKARSSRNSLKHGMSSKDVVLPGESQDEFDSLLADFVKLYQPVGDAESSFVFEMAASRWRIRRLIGMETAVFNEEFKRALNDPESPVEEQPATVIALDRLAHGKGLANIHRYENRLHKAYDAAVRMLLDLQEARLQNPEPETTELQNEPVDEIVEESEAGFQRERFREACFAAVAAQNQVPNRGRQAATGASTS